MPARRPAGPGGSAVSAVVWKCPWLRRVLASLQGECQPCTLRSPLSPGEAVQLKVLRDPIDDDKFHDECGVFGVFGHSEAANITYLGIHALQHRGQESAGIAALDAGQIQVHKTMGLVADNFDAATLARLPGNAAIGHTRYSTAGQSRIENAQPFVLKGSAGRSAGAQTATLVTAEDLRAASGRGVRAARSGVGARRVLASLRSPGLYHRGSRRGRLPSAGAGESARGAR